MRTVIKLWLLVSLFAVPVFSQSNTGRLVGTVSDASGVIPGAMVVVRDDKTDKERTTTSSGDGTFSVPQLDVGTYTVTITAAGHKAFTVSGVKIDIGKDYSLNPVMEVGEISESVTVIAGTDIVNSTNAELSNTVSPRQVLELPLNGRNPLALLNTIAGANATSVSINGQRSSSTNYTRDGVNVQDNFIRTGGFVQDRPTVDDTGEFTVVTHNASADQGGGGSSQVQLVTPRGGQDFHGALWEYNRNVKFAANDFFNNAAGIGRPFLNRNQFGGKLAGPLPLPSFGEGGASLIKGKAFFFAQYERFVLRQQRSVTRTILRNAARTGNFTYVDNSGVTRTVNVLTGAGFSGPIPASAGGVLGVDPTIQARVLNPMPGVGNSTIANNDLTQLLQFNQSDNDTRDGFTTRLDFDINDTNNLYFVYKYNNNGDERQVDPGGFGTNPFVVQSGPVKLYLASYRTSLGSRFINEVRGAYQTAEPFFRQESLPGDFIIGTIAANGLPIAGLPLTLSSPEASFENQGRNTKQYTFQDNASYILGNHSLRFGGDINLQRIEVISNFNVTPIYSITNVNNPLTPRLPAALYPGGINATQRGRADALRYLLGGSVGVGSVAANFVNPEVGPQLGAPSIQQMNYDTLGFYLSDQWRVNSRLTLNLGLRYDVFTPLNNPDRVFLEPLIPAGSNITDAILDQNGSYGLVGTNTGKPGRFYNTDLNNFGPVVSFAYTPEFSNGFLSALMPGQGKTVIRGGFRSSYVNDEYVTSALNAARGNAGLDLTGLAAGAATINARFNSLPGFTLPPFRTPPITFAEANLDNGFAFNTVFAIDPNIQVQRNDEFNIGIQREIGFDTAIEIRYVGGRSNSMVRGVDLNQIDINAGGFLRDFLIARNNCRLQGAMLPGTGDPLLRCTDASFNSLIAGSQPLPAFDSLPFGAFLNNPAVTTPIINGTPADLATIYIQNGLDFDLASGTGIQFRRNFLAGPVDLLVNGGRYRYNALQAEIRRRFTKGLSFQANYTFQKTLSDIETDGQARFDPYLDNNNQKLDYARTDYDRTHSVNINAIYELPFGKGKSYLNGGGMVDRLFGGFQITSLINISSGAPISIRDLTGTLNRGGRSLRQTANSSLTTDQIKDLVGIFHQNGRIYFIDPSVIAPDGTATGGNLGTTPTAAFPGQVFFRAQPGQTGNLPRTFINGPRYFNWDAGLIKNISFSERTRLQLRMEVFNVLNNVNFFAPTGANAASLGEDSNIFNINSATFGQITSGNAYPPRIMQFAARFEF
ncbi:MAG TPA: carboxypeptidase-like regulatory domain-containing protein [Pyrinomonadaceae bacterium]|nr:carboxypeptidase-like regulatory domain-containing protein [Pyrinomonadaceae bacterium]